MNLTLADVTDALAKNNQVTPTGMHEENHTLYLAVVDGRVRNLHEIENLIVNVASNRVVSIKDLRALSTVRNP
ncbi:MAG: efflux transporter permease subunit, partial [Verrucomicrobiales bacterium]|nr:efflux transporter permease subunit [Verrucomicrobiales bacterium]